MLRFHEQFKLLAALDPQTVANTQAVSSWVSVGDCDELLAILFLGDIASETIDFKIQQASDSSGTGAKDLKASTQLAASASANDSKQLQISVRADKLDRANSFTYVRIRAITGGATGGPAAGALYGRSTLGPVSQPSSVLETATL